MKLKAHEAIVVLIQCLKHLFQSPTRMFPNLFLYCALLEKLESRTWDRSISSKFLNTGEFRARQLKWRSVLTINTSTVSSSSQKFSKDAFSYSTTVTFPCYQRPLLLRSLGCHGSKLTVLTLTRRLLSDLILTWYFTSCAGSLNKSGKGISDTQQTQITVSKQIMGHAFWTVPSKVVDGGWIKASFDPWQSSLFPYSSAQRTS